MTSFGSIERVNTGRPLKYRTPSPPRHAVEPLSPLREDASAFWPSHNGSRRGAGDYGHKERNVADETESEDEDEVVGVSTQGSRTSLSAGRHSGSASTMDTFATIALASSPTFSASVPHLSNHYKTFSTPFQWQTHHEYNQERPSKRARSEKPASPEWQRAHSRPATSHATTTAMESDAELLLFLARQPVRSPVTVLSSIGYIESQVEGPHHTIETITQSQKGDEDISMPEAISNIEDDQTNTDIGEAGVRGVDGEQQHLPAYDSMPAYQSDFPVHPDQSSIGKEEEVMTMDSVEDMAIEEHPQDVISLEPGMVSEPRAATNGLEEPKSSKVELLPPPHEFSSSLGHIPSVREDDSDVQQKDPTVNPPILSPKTPPLALNLKNTHSQNGAQAICGICHFTRNSLAADIDSDATSWICCDGCKRWFHFACAGFKSEREVRSVDKYSCRECKPTHGPTTFVRKSARAHTAIDYAGLNEGVVKTSDENPEHHYIKPIKEGTIKFLPDNFPRMRPELVTAEFFERGDGMKEPVVIPAWMNPRPPEPKADSTSIADTAAEESTRDEVPSRPEDIDETWVFRDYSYQAVQDEGQDALDMVIPQGLTVRRVGDLYGLEEKVEVIDVKSQEGEDKKWNMRRWVDYYESTGAKKVRNVISLEVSQSRLGRLIKRPKIVRELDLQDSVWPSEAQAKGDFPKVQFYCLMSVADCYTDFHIDFGGSSVFYHILKGKKTFLFIPPKEKHLKKYEEWCMSQAQNWTFLADQTKECYRVDLSEGDTMLIPSGWIHAVWTPENSLVIGGNFLTRQHYGMQIRIAQIEKATKVARKFRYPHFQKLLWYTAIRYLERDPIPASVLKMFHDGQKYFREIPSYYNFDQSNQKAKPGDDDYHARYYSQYELEGLPDLIRYLLRTALISMGKIADGITADTRNAVKRSIPKGHGEPLDIVKNFAMWSAWKRGNEDIPHWAQPDAVPGGDLIEHTDKKPSAAALRRLEREAAIAAYRIAPERQSARKLSQLDRANSEASKNPSNDADSNTGSPAPSPSTRPSTHTLTPLVNGNVPTQSKRLKNGIRSSVLGPKRMACDKCRKRRIRCKHKDDVEVIMATPEQAVTEALESRKGSTCNLMPGDAESGKLGNGSECALDHLLLTESEISPVSKNMVSNHQLTVETKLDPSRQWTEQPMLDGCVDSTPNETRSLHIPMEDDIPAPVDLSLTTTDIPTVLPATPNAVRDFLSSNDGSKMNNESLSGRRIRSRACEDCRKSKRRCVHDEDGKIDPIKAAETAIPRALGSAKKRQLSGSVQGSQRKRPRKASGALHDLFTQPLNVATSVTVSHRQDDSVPPMEPEPGLSLEDDHHVDDMAQVSKDSCTVQMQYDAVAESLAADTSQGHSEPATFPPSHTVPERSPSEQADAVEDEIQLVATSPAPNMKLETDLPPSTLQPHPPPHSQDFSALVSPPDSSLTDAEISPITSKAHKTPSNSNPPSNRSSEQPKQIPQRYTPESGTATRRARSSTHSASANNNGNDNDKSVSPRPTISHPPTTLGDSTANNKAKRSNKARASSGEASTDADGESLRLIRELAAQDLGLRRRGRT